MVLSGVLSACLSPSRRLADGKKYPDQYSVELETKVHEVFTIIRRRYKVVAEQYCKISPLICMVCLFFKL